MHNSLAGSRKRGSQCPARHSLVYYGGAREYALPRYISINLLSSVPAFRPKEYVMNSVLAIKFTAALILLTSAVAMAADAVSDPLDACNVVWDSPSGNSSGSMPIGNGDIGMNVWVEENGDLLLLISKTDAWDENSRILKVGRVRITLSPSPFAKGQPFRQELKLREGMIEITGGPAKAATIARVWVDANRPVIRVECDGPQPFDVTAQLEVWRTEKRPFQAQEWFSCWHMNGVDAAAAQGYPVLRHARHRGDGGDRVVWYHRNEYSVWPIGMKLQGLESVMAKMKDPLLNRTFGAAIRGKGLVEEATHRRSSRASRPSRTAFPSIR